MLRTIAAALAACLLLLAGPSRASAPPPEAEGVPIVLLVDLDTGQTLLERNAQRRFAPASITKVMTAFLAFEMIEAGKFRPDRLYTMSPAISDRWRRMGSSMRLEPGEAVTGDRLLKGVTSVSANDGAAVLAESAAGSIAKWIWLMNRQASALGMRDTRFGTPHGWPDEGRTFTTARDLVILADALIERHPRKYGYYFGREGLLVNGAMRRNHDPISGVVPGADGLKTGFTNDAGYGFLGSAKRHGTRMVMVVAGADRAKDRNVAAREIIEWGFDAFDRPLLYRKGTPVGRAAVQGGEADSVKLRVADHVRMAVPASGGTAAARATLRYPGPLRAPIARGEQVATLRIEVDGVAPVEVPLVAAEPVNEAGPLERVAAGLVSWFE